MTCPRSNFKWWSLVMSVGFQRLGSSPLLWYHKEECLSLWEGDGLYAENSSSFIMCFTLYSYIIVPISKVGNGIWQASAELRKPKRAKVHVTFSFRDFLSLPCSFTVGTFGFTSVFQDAVLTFLLLTKYEYSALFSIFICTPAFFIVSHIP